MTHREEASGDRFVVGQKFRVVKNGLDESEVVPFIANLIEQNNDLRNRLQHLEGLTKLAERTIIEAGAIAESLRAEIIEKSHEEAAVIHADANVKAKRELADAQRKAEGTLAEAERVAEETLKRAEMEAGNIGTSARTEATAIVSDARRDAEEIATRIAADAEEQRRSVMERLLNSVHELRAETENQTLASAQEAEELLQRAAKLAHEMRQRLGSVFDEMIGSISLDSSLSEKKTEGPVHEEPEPSRSRRSRR
jgi:cell division septum initiation protein DivIVA